MKTVPVTKRALVQRINRALAKRGEVLKTKRGRAAHREYFILKKNAVTRKKVDVEKLGRELEVLNKFERLED